MNIAFLKTATYHSKTTSAHHLEQFYTTFSEIKDRKFDGMIITGAPVEMMPFEDVEYWDELAEIMKWTKTNVTSTLHICWGAQAALFYHFDINKYELPKKCSGVFPTCINDGSEKLLRGFDDVFLAPHSRYTDITIEDLRTVRT